MRSGKSFSLRPIFIDTLQQRTQCSAGVRRTMQVLVRLGVVKREEEIDVLSCVQPVEDGTSFRRYLGHLYRIYDVPIPIQVVAVSVESHTAMGNAIGITRRQD